jgi:hypothetical protein
MRELNIYFDEFFKRWVLEYASEMILLKAGNESDAQAEGEGIANDMDEHCEDMYKPGRPA